MFRMTQNWYIALFLFAVSLFPLHASAQEADFRQRLEDFFEFERSLDGYCLSVEVNHAHSGEGSDIEQEYHQSFLAVDRFTQSIRADVRYSVEGLQGPTRSDAYRMLLVRDLFGYASGFGEGFRSIREERGGEINLLNVPYSPFSTMWVRFRRDFPRDYEKSMMDYSQFFDLEKIISARFEKNKLIGAIAAKMPGTIWEVEFPLNGNYRLETIRKYATSKSDPTQVELSKRSPQFIARVEWQLYEDGYVPSRVTTESVVVYHSPDRKRQVEQESTEYLYRWYQGDVPANVFQQSDVELDLNSPSTLETLFEGR